MSRVPLTFRIFLKGKLVREETLALGVIKLGKVPSAHLRIEDESISRMHAILEMDPKGVVHLIDLGSTRGTFVNGQRINKAQIHSGDTLQVGDATIEVAFGAPVAQPTIAETVVVAPTVVAPAPVAAAPVPPPAARPVPASPLIATPSPAQLQRAFAEQVDDGGAQAVEVAAMLGDSVVGVKHCMDPRSGKITGATIGLIAGGAACVLTSALAFAVSLNVATHNKDALEYWTHVAKKPERAFRPEQTSPVTDVLCWAGIAGIGALAAGLGRARRERRDPTYRIGTAPGVETAVDGVDNHALVSPRGDDFMLNLTHGMDADLVVDGKSTPIAAPVEMPIPAKARIRVRTGATTFLVSSVARPKQQAQPLFALNGRTAAFFGGSLAAHLGLWALVQLASESGASVPLDVNASENTSMEVRNNANEDPVPEQPKDDDGNSDSSGSHYAGQTAMAEGATGDKDSKNPEGHIRIANNGEQKGLSKSELVERVRTEGVLGSETLTSSIHSLVGTDLNTSGFDEQTVWGGMYGPEGSSFGTGAGRFGFGPGGGCFGNDCGGYGTGRYKTIGTGNSAGENWGGPGNGHGQLRRHDAQVPLVNISRPTAVDGGLDREIIRRYVNRQRTRISYCYEKQLLAKPGLTGDVVVQFLVQPNGTVATANGAGMDSEVASCVADAIHDISFPAPTDGGSVQVKYPFHFQQSGQK